MQSPMARTGRRTRRARKPSGWKLRFASSSRPVNQADKVAVTALRYTARGPLALPMRIPIRTRTSKNSRITAKKPRS